MSESCSLCRFWLKDVSASDHRGPTFELGACRLRPPELMNGLVGISSVASQIPPATAALGRATRYPVTAASDWCGRFEVQRAGPIVVEFPDAMVEFGHRTFQLSRPARD